LARVGGGIARAGDVAGHHGTCHVAQGLARVIEQACGASRVGADAKDEGSNAGDGSAED
jgi:hypothetical protein